MDRRLLPIKYDRIGETYNGWFVIDYAGKDRGNKTMWLCRCLGCGVEKKIDGYNLQSGRSKKCRPCSALEVAAKTHKTHGLTRTKVYRAWQSMKTRCYNEKQEQTFKYHGAMGVKVHPGWMDDFEAFYAHIGDPPSDLHSVDRINAFGDYVPGNVRWSTQAEQMANTRRARKYFDQSHNEDLSDA